MIELLLNRLRGTGAVFSISKLDITGVMMYALWLAVVVGVMSSWIVGVCTAIAYIIGESFAWGKWVGFLVDYEDEHTPEYDSKVGKKFPYIHYVAEMIVSEKVNYKRYCQVALAIRGFVWWMPVYGVLAAAGLIGWSVALLCGVMLGIGWPVACAIGRELDIKYKIGVLEFKRGWENQEAVYGLVQGLVFWLVVVI